jgi:hypothetical protein
MLFYKQKAHLFEMSRDQSPEIQNELVDVRK